MPRKATAQTTDGAESKGDGALLVLARTTKSFAVYNEETATKAAADGAILYWPIERFKKAKRPQRLILSVREEEE